MVCNKCNGFRGEEGKAYGYAGKWCMCPIPTLNSVNPNLGNISDSYLKELLAQRLYDNLKNCKNSKEIAEELESFFKVDIIKD